MQTYPKLGLIADILGTNDNARIYMPTAFTPNDDGLNDVIKRYTQNVSSINFVVYDGNNNVVFSTTQINQSWSTTGGSNLLGLVPRSSASPLGLSVGCE